MRKILFIQLVFLLIACTSNSQVERESRSNPSKNEISPVTEWRFAVISDLNKSYGSTDYDAPTKKAVQYISDSQNKIQFAISTGDMVAGQKSGLNYKAMWESFHKTVTRPLKQSGIALYPSPGNHDAYRTYATEREHYENSWKSEDILPVNQQFELLSDVPQDYPFAYAFKVGPALFVALDATDARPLTSEDVDWLESVLIKNRSVKHKFVFGHVPLLPFAFDKETEYLARGSQSFLEKLEKLFEDYDVSVLFTGHSHVYYPGQRSGKTQFISVPLLGSGARYLIQKQGQTQRSETGFLVVSYKETGELKIQSLRASDFSEIQDEQMPEWLDLPASNIKGCKSCTQFPRAMFLDTNKRIIYKRRN